jgi:alpha-tubulin suppressor-like RCC1 family protein
VRAAAITAGVDHTCALTSAGDVKCWGYNGHDELGTGRGDNQNSSTPVNVSGLRSGVTAISAGVRHTCALLRTGRVKCWGANYSGALGDGTTDRHFAPIDVVALSGVVAISAGYDHSCALTGAGGVKCWGSNTFGVLGDGTTDDRWTPTDVSGLSSGVTVVATGNLITCAVTSAGGVKCWGYHYGLTPVDVAGVGGVIAITAAGPICALTGAGGVKCWSGDYGWTPVGVPGLDSGVTAIAANVGHACALTSRGSVKCWGENDHGQLGDGTKAMRPTPVAVSGLSTGVTAIGAGAFHTCAVTRNGGAKCWGVNGVGELGDGTTHTRLTPVGVVGFGPRAKLAIVSRMVTVTPARIAPLKLRCEAARCRGILTLVKLGSRRFSIAAGHTRAVKVKLTTRGFQLLVRKGRLSTRARASYEQPAGDPTVATRRITLEAPK